MHLKQLRFSDYPLCLLGTVLKPHEDRLRVLCFNHRTQGGAAIALAQKNVVAAVLTNANNALRRSAKPVRLTSIEVVQKKFHRILIVYSDTSAEEPVRREIVISMYEPSKKNKNKPEEGDDEDTGADT
jgi:hypothetical protein